MFLQRHTFEEEIQQSSDHIIGLVRLCCTITNLEATRLRRATLQYQILLFSAANQIVLK
jgi:hypothetical protein